MPERLTHDEMCHLKELVARYAAWLEERGFDKEARTSRDVAAWVLEDVVMYPRVTCAVFHR